MRFKSFIMRYDFCMWNSRYFRIEIRKNENEKINKQLIDNFFIDFDVISNVAIVKCESLNKTNREDIFAENIWFRDVAKKINETDCEISETNEQKIADFSMTLYVDSNAKTRKSKLLTDFRAWFWRRCSWNLLLKLKFCLHRLQIVLQIVRTQTICWIDNFFIDFDAKLNARNWSFERFDETNCKDVSVFDVRFLDVVKINDSCEKDEQVSIDFFSNSHNNLSVKLVKNEFLNEIIDFENVDIFTNLHVVLIVLIRFKTSCSRMCSKNFLLKLKFCLQNLHNVRTHATSWIDAFFIVSNIITNVFNEKFKRDAFNFANK